MTVFLGVDGGGTKTAFCLVDRGGAWLRGRRPRAPTTSRRALGSSVACCARAWTRSAGRPSTTPAGIDHAFFGLPSYGEVSADVPALDAAPGEVLGHDRYRCDNDMVCGWAGSLGGADGINVISGTGSMTYGEKDGRGARVGGWGELFGDEGSAYWISVRALNTFSRMSDGRLPAGPLHGMIRERLGLASDLDLVDVVLNRWQGRRGEIAALSRTVVEAASAGDGHAARILAEAAGELADMVDVTRRRLAFGPGERVPVSYSGGVFTAEPVLEGFGAALAARYDGYELREPLYPPDVGAALYAAKLAGDPLDDGALRALNAARRVPQQS